MEQNQKRADIHVANSEVGQGINSSCFLNFYYDVFCITSDNAVLSTVTKKETLIYSVVLSRPQLLRMATESDAP